MEDHSWRPAWARKLARPDFKKQTGYGRWYILGISAMGKVKVGGSQSKAGLGKSMRPYLKHELKQKGLRYSSNGRTLSSKCKTLDSNPSASRKRKGRKEEGKKEEVRKKKGRKEGRKEGRKVRNQIYSETVR
jgi:hypothetical protein